MALPSVGSLVQNTARTWTITLAGDGTLDLTTATGAHLLVHRTPPGSSVATVTETWAASIAGGATFSSLVLDVAMLGATTGPNAVPTAGESLRVRPYLSFSGGPDVEFGDPVTKLNQLRISVVEA